MDPPARRFRILVVDDSATARFALRKALERDPEVAVVGEASDRKQTLAAVARLDPDLVTLDVHLRGEDGVDIAAELMGTSPRPVLIVTGVDPRNPALAFRALDAGALDVMAKLPAETAPTYEAERRRLVRAVRALAQVPVVTRRTRRGTTPPALATPTDVPSRRAGAGRSLVLIGASTGGPPILEQLLRDLPSPIPGTVVIVQHIAAGFAQGLADWLAVTSRHPVHMCRGVTTLERGVVYLAPDNLHLTFHGPRAIGIDDGPPRGFHKPSIDRLFETAAAHVGPEAIALLLTGMGQDGAAGLAALRRAGAATYAQTPDTCVVASMPSAAIERGAVDGTLTPSQIGPMLLSALQRS